MRSAQFLILLLALRCFGQVGVEMPILYQQTSSAFPTPANLAGLIIWLDAIQGSINVTNTSNANPADGDQIKTWKDLSGNGYHGGSRNPPSSIYHSTGGGQDGTNSYILINSTAGMGFTNRCGVGNFTQPNAIIYVWNWQPTGDGLWNAYSNQNTQLNFSSSAIHMFATGSDQVAGNPVNSGLYAIDTWIFNGASTVVRHNGTNQPGSFSAVGTGNCQGYSIANYNININSGSPMNLLAVVWANTSDVTAIHNDVENYYARKTKIQGYNF